MADNDSINGFFDWAALAETVRYHTVEGHRVEVSDMSGGMGWIGFERPGVTVRTPTGDLVRIPAEEHQYGFEPMALVQLIADLASVVTEEDDAITEVYDLLARLDTTGHVAAAVAEITAARSLP